MAHSGNSWRHPPLSVGWLKRWKMKIPGIVSWVNQKGRARGEVPNSKPNSLLVCGTVLHAFSELTEMGEPAAQPTTDGPLAWWSCTPTVVKRRGEYSWISSELALKPRIIFGSNSFLLLSHVARAASLALLTTSSWTKSTGGAEAGAGAMSAWDRSCLTALSWPIQVHSAVISAACWARTCLPAARSGLGMLLDGGGAWAGGAILDVGDPAGIGGIAPVADGGGGGGVHEGEACWCCCCCVWGGDGRLKLLSHKGPAVPKFSPKCSCIDGDRDQGNCDGSNEWEGMEREQEKDRKRRSKDTEMYECIEQYRRWAEARVMHDPQGTCHSAGCCCQLPQQARGSQLCAHSKITTLTDFVCLYASDNLVNYVIGGWPSGVANTDFNFSKIEVWSSMHMQIKSFHSTNKVMPSQHVSACPPCCDWWLGCYDNVIVNTDNSKHWPWSGFDSV